LLMSNMYITKSQNTFSSSPQGSSTSRDLPTL
jgi:hypothetical protein